MNVLSQVFFVKSLLFQCIHLQNQKKLQIIQSQSLHYNLYQTVRTLFQYRHLTQHLKAKKSLF